MTTEHKYAQVLRWIADGKKIQWQTGAGEWIDQKHDPALLEIANNDWSPGRYRLKPRTIMIGDVECEAPVLEPCNKQVVFTWNDAADGPSLMSYHGDIHWHRVLAKNGALFGSKEACVAAHNAITKLLTQSAKD